jgi:hypothetical protein
MNMTEDATVALVIGGIGDGMRHAVLGNNLRIAKPVWNWRSRPTEDAVNRPEPLDVDDYRLEWFRSGQRRFAMYIVNHMSHEIAVERLFLCYKGAGE